jgi:hypothetical protein
MFQGQDGLTRPSWNVQSDKEGREGEEYPGGWVQQEAN